MSAWGEEVTWTASSAGYTNGQEVTSVVISEKISITFDKGENTNSPKYYTTGSAVRIYGGGLFTVEAKDATLDEISLSFGTGDGSNEITVDEGSYKPSLSQWVTSKSGKINTVTFNVSGSTGHRRLSGLTVKYTVSGNSSTTTYNVTASANISNGTVTADKDKAAVGETVTLTAHPNAGYKVENWSLTNAYGNDGKFDITTISDNQISFIMKGFDMKYYASFIEDSPIPSITAESTLNIPYTEGDGTFDVTWTGMKDVDVNLYTDEECTSAFDGSWFQADLDVDNNIYYVSEENATNSSRTVYMQLYGLDSESEEYTQVVTVTQAAAPQKYTVTIIAPENGTLAVTCGGEDVVSGSTYAVGQDIKVVASPANGYKFRNIQVVDATTHTYTSSNEKVWTMGEHEITISANFDEIQQYTVAFSVNGSIVKSDRLQEGAAVTVPEDPEAINGKVFTGWIETATVEGTTPAYVTPSATVTKTVTYYAVFATQTGSAGGEVTEELTNTEVNSLSNSAALAYTTETTYTDGDIDYSIYGYTDNTNRKWIQLKKDKGVYIKMITPNPIKKVEVTITASNNSTGGINDITKHTAYSGYVALCTSDCTYSTTSGSVASSNVITNNVANLQPTGDNKELYLKVSSGARIWSISVTYGEPASYSDFTTTPDPLAQANLTISGVGYATYYNAFAYTMPENVVGKIMKNVEGVVKSVDVYEAGDVVPAETALLLKGTPNTYTLVETRTAASKTAEGNLLKGNLTKGSTTGGDAGAKYYKFANGENGLGWYYGSSDNTDGHAFEIGANKAYLVINGSSEVKALSFVSIEDNEEDAIKNVEEKTFDTVIYDMQGRKVSKAQKGLYIINGRKVVK